MDPQEISLVRQYAVNEIAGALILGHFTLKSNNSFVRTNLTYHAYDEFKHAWLWTEFLKKNKVSVDRVGGRNEYFEFIAAQTDEIDFLAAVHIYELRVPFHLGLHAQVPQINPGLREVVQFIADDERHHLGWIRNYLVKKMETDRDHVMKAVRQAESVEEKTYLAHIGTMKQAGGYIADLASILEKNLSTFPKPSDYFNSPAQNG